MPKGERFLSPEELGEKIEEWKGAGAREKSKPGKPIGFHGDVQSSDIAAAQVNFPYVYEARRVEKSNNPTKDIAYWHGESFIDKVIPRLLKNKEKIKILDIGGGVGLFAQQLRDTFGDKVDVFTTGIRKKNAKIVRKQNDQELHPQDLKWRSVLQLSDFPEFDLVVDTMGESMYGAFEAKEKKQYLNAVAKKLMPGGYASIVGMTEAASFEPDFLKIIHEVENECGVNIKVYNSGMVKIEKPLQVK